MNLEFKCLFPETADELIEREEVDQKIRTEYMDRRSVDSEAEFDKTVDKDNTEALKDIVSRIGWPTITKVGAEASNSAWLLVQHADDVEFQEHCLLLMKEEKRGEVNLHNIAYLEDKIATKKGRLQIYGTQFNVVNNKIEPYPIADLETVNQRRAGMGMKNLEEYLRIDSNTL